MPDVEWSDDTPETPAVLVADCLTMASPELLTCGIGAQQIGVRASRPEARGPADNDIPAVVGLVHRHPPVATLPSEGVLEDDIHGRRLHDDCRRCLGHGRGRRRH